jgi:hypothetical protein
MFNIVASHHDFLRTTSLGRVITIGLPQWFDKLILVAQSLHKATGWGSCPRCDCCCPLLTVVWDNVVHMSARQTGFLIRKSEKRTICPGLGSTALGPRRLAATFQ